MPGICISTCLPNLKLLMKGILKQVETTSSWTESESESHSVMSDSLQLHGLYSPWNSPGQNTGESSLFLLQGIFPTQGLNPRLPHCRQILYQLSHKGSSKQMRSYQKDSGTSLNSVSLSTLGKMHTKKQNEELLWPLLIAEPDRRRSLPLSWQGHSQWKVMDSLFTIALPT